MPAHWVDLSVGYSHNQTDEERLRKLNDLRDELVADGYLSPDYPKLTYYHQNLTILATDEAIVAFMSRRFEVKISTDNPVPCWINQMLSTLTDRMTTKGFNGDNGSMDPYDGKYYGEHFNQRVEVHTPGNALATYNRVMLMEDACTDALQEKLSEGWRIIAVCPQPDQRRPDYILGSYSEPNTNDSRAYRG